MVAPDKPDKASLKRLKRRDKAAWKAEKRKEKQRRKSERWAQRRQVDYRAELDRSIAVELLERIVEGLRAGSVKVQRGDQELTIEPADAVRLRVRARQTHKSEGVRINMRWPRQVTAPAESLTVAGPNGAPDDRPAGRRG